MSGFQLTTAKTIIGISATMLLFGCAFNGPKENNPAFAPVSPEAMKPPPNYTGGIYQSGYSVALFRDRKAHRVGDILTIALVENTSGSKSANTKTSRNTKIDIANANILGSPVQFKTPKFLPLKDTDGNTLATSIDSKADFEGKGDSNQSNQLSGTITVTVSKVLPNGNLVVRGEKWIHLNRGKEYIRLSGIVRPDDINDNNVVESIRVADARISYSGTGQVAESNVAGWLGRFFMGALTGLWPF